MVGLAIWVVRAGWRLQAWWLWAGIGLGLVSLGSPYAHTVAAFAVEWLESFLAVLVAVAITVLFLRDNIMAYVAVIFCTRMANPLVESFSQSNQFFFKNGVALALLTAVVLFWMFWTPGEGGETDGVAPPASLPAAK
jgi:hypothetical protein